MRTIKAKIDPDAPEMRRLVAQRLLIASPFVLDFWLAWLQSAPSGACLVIAAACMAMCLGAAGLYSWRGSKSETDLIWLQIILRLFSR